MTKQRALLTVISIVGCAYSYGWNNTSNPYSFSGKVGVGTESPTEKFVVNNVSMLIQDDGWTWLKIKSTVSGKDPGIVLYDYQGDFWKINLDESDNDRFEILWNNSHKLWLKTNGDLTVDGRLITEEGSVFFEDRMRLYGVGNDSADLRFKI